VVVLYAIRYTCAAAAILAIFYLYDRVRGWPLTAQAWAGRRTLGMYVVQPYVLLVVSAYLTKSVLVLALTAFVGSLLVTWVLERSSLTRLVLLGQRTRSRSTAS